MQIEVTSVSKKAESLSGAAAAVFVITREDLRRSGAQSIPDALRMVPGIHVARLDANKWGVSARGFNDRFSGKLLVLIDGRPIYTHSFSGVYWDMHDVPMDDIERIEVIRGPGASLWGANAMNGIINILTKSAADTQGGMVSAEAGLQGQSGVVRYGGRVGEELYYRLYAKSFYHDDFVLENGDDSTDHWHRQQSGFRLDWTPTERDTIMIQGGVFGGETGTLYRVAQFTSPPPEIRIGFDERMVGGHFVTRWTRAFSAESELSLQFNYDVYDKDFLTYAEQRHQIDLDLQHRFPLLEGHDFLWGIGYRISPDEIEGTPFARFDQSTREFQLVNAFLQDEITLIPDELLLTLGSKFEYNTMSGLEIQPTARLAWSPSDTQTVWAAVSRAVRTPARYEHDVAIALETLAPGSAENPLPLPLVIQPTGDDSFDAEDSLSYEIGYRAVPVDWLSYDIAAFYTKYDNLLNAVPAPLEFSDQPAPGYFIVPLLASNSINGEVYGVEAAIDWQAASWNRFRIAYTFTDIQLHDESGNGQVFEEYEGRSPHHSISIRDEIDLTSTLELDLWLRYADTLPTSDVAAYITMDARLGWMPTKQLEVAVGVRYAFNPSLEEFTSTIIDTAPSEIERNLYASVTWRF